ncbi:MAG: hypothetical protein WC757_03385 [Candidatus Paceibacterota bacterium]|jgi:hypothetical protein
MFKKIFVFSVVTLAIVLGFVFAPAAKAQSTDAAALLAQIQALSAQLNSLNTQYNQLNRIAIPPTYRGQIYFKFTERGGSSANIELYLTDTTNNAVHPISEKGYAPYFKLSPGYYNATLIVKEYDTRGLEQQPSRITGKIKVDASGNIFTADGSTVKIDGRTPSDFYGAFTKAVLSTLGVNLTTTQGDNQSEVKLSLRDGNKIIEPSSNILPAYKLGLATYKGEFMFRENGDASYASANYTVEANPTGYNITEGFNSTPSETGASASVVGTPTLVLSYNSTKKETDLTLGATIKITAGNTDLKIAVNNPFTGSLLNSRDGNSGMGNYQRRMATSTTNLQIVGDDATSVRSYVIPAGQTASFKFQMAFNPLQMFAGAYHGTFTGVGIADGKGVSYLPINTNKSNFVTIVGEKSPYIKSVTSPVKAGGVLTILGARLDSDQLFVDGKASEPRGIMTTNDKTKIYFTVPSTWANGWHSIQFNSVNGLSNIVGFEVTGNTPSQPSITLRGTVNYQTHESSTITPNIGDTFTISGIPEGLKGMSYYSRSGYPTSGYYSRAFFFDQTFGNNNSCGNNAGDDEWTMHCTAKVPGTSTFYVQIYANGQIYTSNKITVTIPSRTATTPSITVLTPSGAEIYKPEQEVLVRFTTNLAEGTPYQVSLMGKAYEVVLATSNVNAKDVQGALIKIPQGVLRESGSVYNIKVSTDQVKGGLLESDSNSFTISAQTTQPSISNVTLDKTSYRVGDGMIVRWSATGMPTNSNVTVELTDTRTSQTGILATVRSSGPASTTIPATMSGIAGSIGAGNVYKVNVVYHTTSNTGIVKSSGLFTINPKITTSTLVPRTSTAPVVYGPITQEQAAAQTQTQALTPITYSCTGTKPTGVTTCSGDTTGLSSSIAWASVSGSAGCTTARKCQYYTPTVATAAPSAWCHTFTTGITRGTASADVSYLQTALTKEGLAINSNEKTQRLYGTTTANAVLQYKIKYNLSNRSADAVGDGMNAKLNTTYKCTTSALEYKSQIASIVVAAEKVVEELKAFVQSLI